MRERKQVLEFFLHQGQKAQRQCSRVKPTADPPAGPAGARADRPGQAQTQLLGRVLSSSSNGACDQVNSSVALFEAQFGLSGAR